MNITYIHHSGFLVETEDYYYLFDYEFGMLPRLDAAKPIFVLSSHSHKDHYNPEVFGKLAGMQQVRAILSDDIFPPEGVDVLRAAPEQSYHLAPQVTLTTLRSTDQGVAFLIEDHGQLIYHAGDLNDWVWEGEPDDWNEEMTEGYRRQIRLLGEKLDGRAIDTAFVVLDPRQEAHYARGLCYFLENIPAKQVYPMHYWGNPAIIETFLADHPRYRSQIQKTESTTARRAERGNL